MFQSLWRVNTNNKGCNENAMPRGKYKGGENLTAFKKDESTKHNIHAWFIC